MIEALEEHGLIKGLFLGIKRILRCNPFTNKKYVYDRFKFLSEVAPYFKKVYEKYGTTDAQMLQILTPHALDDAGAVCAAMMKAQMKDKSLK